MNNESLVKDPVFQLNILLWMAKDQPQDGYRVRPLFVEHNFKIIYIEKPFAFPEETSRAVLASSLSISTAPVPELILGRDHNGKALYFEAKADSFSPDSARNAKQARGHLLATGPAFQEALTPLTSGLLCYVVPADKRALMFDCLTYLAQELASEGLEHGSFSSHGLKVTEKQLVYVWDSVFKGYVGLSENSATILRDVQDDADPSPLLLVFSDEDCPNNEMRDFYRQVVIEQVRARLLCDLQTLHVNQVYEKSADELLLDTSDGVFQYLGRERQKRLQRLVRENLFRPIRDHWTDKQQGIKLDHGQLSVRWQSESEKESFLTWLEDRRVKFETTRPIEKTMPLLDGLPEPSGEEV